MTENMEEIIVDGSNPNVTWKWFLNDKEQWTATATIEDAGNTITMDAQKVISKGVIDGTEYHGEIEYKGITYTNDIVIMRDDITQPITDVTPEEEVPEVTEESVSAMEQESDEIQDKWEGITEKEITNALKQITETVRMIESIWDSDKKEYNITESHIRQLYKFNEDHRDPMPEGLSPEEAEKWDHFNGIKKLTEEDVEKIFGKEHDIIGVAHSQTLDRINTVVGDFFSWTYAIHQYKEIYNAYQEYIEDQEESNIQQLRDAIELTDDPDKKEELNKVIDFYYHRKYLGFLKEVDDKTKERIKQAWKDSKKLDYWINRSRDKLTRMKISNQIILEISQFEKRFMEPRYHRINNILLTYFLNLTTYCKPDDKEDQSRNMVVCMVFALDSIIRKTAKPEVHQQIMSNIEAFEEEMLKIIPDDRDMSELHPSEKPDGLAGDFSNGVFQSFSDIKKED